MAPHRGFDRGLDRWSHQPIPSAQKIQRVKPTVILDPGHGMGNRKRGVFDPGAVSDGFREADITMDWVNEIRGALMKKRIPVVRTRVDNSEHCPVSARAKIAVEYNGAIMLSLHCNAATGEANGTETFYRGEQNKARAEAITRAVCDVLVTRNRGAKTEAGSQHKTLAVMAFQPCFLLEIGFIDNDSDRAKMLDPELRKAACERIAEILIA
jgi:N-acetylmuramoyl-L-alanine amidase